MTAPHTALNFTVIPSGTKRFTGAALSILENNESPGSFTAVPESALADQSFGGWPGL